METPPLHHVFFIEGVHGVGKTEVCKLLAEKNPNLVTLISENILEPDQLWVPKSLHPQSMIMEMRWCIEKLMDIVYKIEEKKPKVLVTDRSPYSAAIYLRPQVVDKPESLKNIAFNVDIQKTIMWPSLLIMSHEVVVNYNVKFHLIILSAEKESVWKRIQKRLTMERKKFGEEDRTWFDEKFEAYTEMGVIINSCKGDIEKPTFFTNNDDELEKCVDEITKYIKKTVEK
jgi:deoxyadenosine/deoxycytidine kinase